VKLARKDNLDNEVILEVPDLLVEMVVLDNQDQEEQWDVLDSLAHKVHPVMQGHKVRQVVKANLVIKDPLDLQDLWDLWEKLDHLVMKVTKDLRVPLVLKDLVVIPELPAPLESQDL
jgi:hypothetical protein